MTNEQTKQQTLQLALLRYRANPNQDTAQAVAAALAARRDEMEEIGLAAMLASEA